MINRNSYFYKGSEARVSHIDEYYAKTLVVLSFFLQIYPVPQHRRIFMPQAETESETGGEDRNKKERSKRQWQSITENIMLMNITSRQRDTYRQRER